MGSLTSTELPTEANTGVIVTLAVWSIDAAKIGCMTHTLPTITATLTVAYLRVIGREAVTQQSALFIAFALSSQKPRMTHAHATLESSPTLSALATVSWKRLLAVTRAKRLQFHLQDVL